MAKGDAGIIVGSVLGGLAFLGFVGGGIYMATSKSQNQNDDQANASISQTTQDSGDLKRAILEQNRIPNPIKLDIIDVPKDRKTLEALLNHHVQIIKDAGLNLRKHEGYRLIINDIHNSILPALRLFEFNGIYDPHGLRSELIQFYEDVDRKLREDGVSIYDAADYALYKQTQPVFVNQYPVEPPAEPVYTRILLNPDEENDIEDYRSLWLMRQ